MFLSKCNDWRVRKKNCIPYPFSEQSQNAGRLDAQHDNCACALHTRSDFRLPIEKRDAQRLSFALRTCFFFAHVFRSLRKHTSQPNTVQSAAAFLHDYIIDDNVGTYLQAARQLAPSPRLLQEQIDGKREHIAHERNGADGADGRFHPQALHAVVLWWW